MSGTLISVLHMTVFRYSTESGIYTIISKYHYSNLGLGRSCKQHVESNNIVI